MNPDEFGNDLAELVDAHVQAEDDHAAVLEGVQEALADYDTEDALATSAELLGGTLEEHPHVNVIFIAFGDPSLPTLCWSCDDNKVFVAKDGVDSYVANARGAGRSSAAARRASDEHVLAMCDEAHRRGLVGGGAKQAEIVTGARGAFISSQAVLDELDRLQARAGRSYVTLADLRDEFGEDVTREQFDDTVNDLRREWLVSLSPAEGLHHTPSRRELDAGILDPGTNRVLIYIRRRDQD